MKIREKGYPLLLILTVILALAALSTLIPQAYAHKACLLGYRTHCTLTPWSTLICIALAGVLCTVRRRLFTKET